MGNHFASDVQTESLKISTANKEFETILHIDNGGIIYLEDSDYTNFTMSLSQEQLIELRNFLNEHVKYNQQ